MSRQSIITSSTTGTSSISENEIRALKEQVRQFLAESRLGKVADPRGNIVGWKDAAGFITSARSHLVLIITVMKFHTTPIRYLTQGMRRKNGELVKDPAWNSGMIPDLEKLKILGVFAGQKSAVTFTTPEEAAAFKKNRGSVPGWDNVCMLCYHRAAILLMEFSNNAYVQSIAKSYYGGRPSTVSGNLVGTTSDGTADKPTRNSISRALFESFHRDMAALDTSALKAFFLSPEIALLDSVDPSTF